MINAISAHDISDKALKEIQKIDIIEKKILEAAKKGKFSVIIEDLGYCDFELTSKLTDLGYHVSGVIRIPDQVPILKQGIKIDWSNVETTSELLSGGEILDEYYTT